MISDKAKKLRFLLCHAEPIIHIVGLMTCIFVVTHEDVTTIFLFFGSAGLTYHVIRFIASIAQLVIFRKKLKEDIVLKIMKS